MAALRVLVPQGGRLAFCALQRGDSNAAAAAARFSSSFVKLRCKCAAAETAPENEEGIGSSLKVAAGAVDLETISAQITPIIDEFFVSDAQGDPDKPMQGFSHISEAIEAIGEGTCVVLVDESNISYLVMAASLVTPEQIEFVKRSSSGLIYCAMSGRQLDRLKIPLMDPENDNVGSVSVDVELGTTTGVSPQDRANTLLALATSESRPEHFRRPGHIFPLRCHNNGVLYNSGFPEAAMDLVGLAGLPNVAVLAHLVIKDSGDYALPDLEKSSQFAAENKLPIIKVADIVRYMRKREKLVERTAVARLPTKWGEFKAYSYNSKLNDVEHVAYVKGDIGDGQDVLVRVHSECLTGDILGSLRCPCGNSLALAMQRIERAGRGVLVYLRGHEGMRVRLSDKLLAYSILDEGQGVVEEKQVDSRDYGIGAQILRDIGVRTMKLMTNNPAKYLGLRGYGLAVTSQISFADPQAAEEEEEEEEA